jgi:microcystin-dependent protein
MAEPFVGQILTAAFNFAPKGFALCAGSLLSIAQNQALFSLLGTTYGGDGITTFKLPDLRGRVTNHMGQGPGLSNYVEGESAGTENVTLYPSNLPQHNHLVNASTAGGATTPIGSFPGVDGGEKALVYAPGANGVMNATMVGLAGGNQPHNNMQPYLVINFCIALYGIYPSRN